MNLNEFNDNYLNILLQKISKEKKNVFLLGDFNWFTFLLYVFAIYLTSS